MKAQLIDHMGTDLSVVNAARVSFDKMSDWERDVLKEWVDVHPHNGDEIVRRELGAPRLADADARLIRYLATHDHWTPFAHTAISFRMAAPVPIRTQCFKHKAGMVENEESRRYISSRPELYIPDTFRKAPEGSIKQGSGEAHPNSDVIRKAYAEWAALSIEGYMMMIAEGVCPEQARLLLPQGVMVNWVWTGNLASFARFFNQRTAPYAQQEIKWLAEQVGKHIELLFPQSWKALTQK